MRTLVTPAGLIAILSVTPIASSASAAQPVLNVHGGPVTNGPFPDTWCDEVEGTKVERAVVQVRVDARGRLIQNARTTTVFTATATGKSIEYSSAGVVKDSVIENGDGTTTSVSKGAASSSRSRSRTAQCCAQRATGRSAAQANATSA
jgi:hypothetical protein